MNRFLKKLPKLAASLSACLLLLASCAGDTSPSMNTWPTEEDGLTPGKGRAIVVLSVMQEYKNALLIRGESVSYAFRRDPPLIEMEDGKPIKKWRVYGFGGDVLAIEPGHYYLSAFRVDHVSHRGGWDAKTNKPKVFDFTVEAGEVVYLGHVVTRRPKPWTGEYLLMRVESREDDARQLIVEEFGPRGKEIAARMQTRLVTVPKAIW